MADSYNFSSFKLLLLDDNSFVRTIVRKLCRSFGFSMIEEAENVEQALALLDTAHFDMAICDWEMKPLDGSEFVKRVRSKADGPLRYLRRSSC
jgi:two-component system, chemotaxis family, chemotaxis protein CheY